MNAVTGLIITAAPIGVGATLIMDLWGLLAARLFKFQLTNYALVGRWIGHMPRGRFVHDSIARAAPVAGEGVIGWAAHYAIGISFAILLLSIEGVSWAREPTLLPALLVGIVTVAAPLLVMQPGMGAGIAASRTPNPNLARLRSFLNHSVFGLGLYGAAVAVNTLH